MPDSGIQFLDLTIPRGLVDGTVRTFAEERLKVGDEVIWGLAPAPPVPSSTEASNASADVLRVSARTIVDAVLDQWLPLPYLRFIARDGNGRARFDQGPNNWARLYISSAPASDHDRFAAVIAFDTRIDPHSRLDLSTYVMPTIDDVRFASTFAVTDDAEELAPFLAEPWLQDWIHATFPLLQPSRPSGAPQSHGLQQIAGYLTLLTVLRRAGIAPSLQFFDTTRDTADVIPVDVVLDIGTTRSAALVVESRGGRPVLSEARLLDLRDLANPTRTYHGAFESRVAFDRAVFGSEAFSRRSGRADAFEWPSLVRTGPEASRLAARSKQTDGAVGLAEPKSHLADLTPRADTWRFTADPARGLLRGTMISGRLLHFAGPSVGLLTGPAGSPSKTNANTGTASKVAVLRPRHALSAMTSFLIAELVQQTLSAINAPTVTGAQTQPDGTARDGVRHLRQIVLPVPLTMPLDERDLLRERAEAAVDMVWDTLGWSSAPPADDVARRAAKPLVRLGVDETLSAQLVYLYDQIAHRFDGDDRALLDIIGKSRPEYGVHPCVRFGAIDIGGGHTTMTIVTYASTSDAPLTPNLLGAQRSRIAGGTLLDAIASTILLPAVANAIAAAGGEHPHRFLETLLATASTASTRNPFDPTDLGVRLSEFWLRPAALTLLQMTDGLAAHAATQTLTLNLGGLVAARGPLNTGVSGELSVALEAIRSEPIDLASVSVSVRFADIAAVTRSVLAPMLTSLSRAIVASDCDLVLLTGWAARLATVRALLIEQMPWRPDRIVSLADHAWQDWYPLAGDDRLAADGKDVALVGALLALAGGERLGFASGSDFGLGDVGIDAGSATASDGWRSAGAAPGGGTS